MFVYPRPLIRNLLLIAFTILLLFCIRDSIYQVLSGTPLFLEKTGFDYEDGSPRTTETPTNDTRRELMLIQMLFRHGHRAPFMLYPYDPNSPDDWTEGLGMLTQLGRLQHYAMGVHLRRRYKDFITSNPQEIEMINSNNFRCQFGVYCLIAGLYAPSPEFRFTDELDWQPMISRNADWQGRNILTRAKCKISDEESRALKGGPEGQATKEYYRNLYNFWSRNSGRLIDVWTLAADLGKTIACEKEYNLTIPEWSLKYWDEFNLQAGISYYFNYGTKLIQRYRIGALLRFMIEKMNEKILHKLEDKRVFLYSAHGSNIACLLLGLDQYNWLGPPYASTVVLELWKEPTDYTVRWLYFNSSNPEKRIDPPVVLRLDGVCKEREFCPLSDFMRLVRRLIPENWTEECNDPNQKARFLPFESPVHVPFLKSSGGTNNSWIFNSFILTCLFLYMRLQYYCGV